MVARNAADTAPAYPSPGAVLALLKPITWFPPMWAYACGVISAGSAIEDRSLHIIGGILLAGPLICGASQAVNDWFDRHVDAINEPWRVIPSGRMPGRWGLWIAIINSLLSLAVAALLGTYVFIAAIIGIVLAWAYSMPPVRLKANGWYGNAAVGISYETLPWLTAAAAALGAAPSMPVFIAALAYGIGAHGIMTL
ncbi:MAG TPA: UbiA family prenyltransferase, partial [Rhizobiaceae bacterium]|nr:UbiA family prenyltransferase [Rhizobiaceae bacterium]